MGMGSRKRWGAGPLWAIPDQRACGLTGPSDAATLRAMWNCLDLGIKLVIVAALLVLVSSPGYALAWGWEGHRIVAEIAEQYLEPETARQVRELLAMDNATTLAEVSTWADDIRGQRRETARWHYVNIPIHPPAGTPAGYDAARDFPQYERLADECVIILSASFVASSPDMSKEVTPSVLACSARCSPVSPGMRTSARSKSTLLPRRATRAAMPSLANAQLHEAFSSVLPLMRTLCSARSFLLQPTGADGRRQLRGP